ncbi:MAG TPA: hypothetical protein VIX89_13775, partial [Bryobacteraceae bacterium]
EAIGSLGAKEPNRFPDADRGLPSVPEEIEEPLFTESIGEPFNEGEMLANHENRTEDIADNIVESASNGPKESVKSAKIPSTSKWVPKSKVKVVQATKTNLGKHKFVPRNGMPNLHNMPVLDLSHKACGVDNCMSCAFNVMHAYFNSKRAASSKTAPRQHMNNTAVKEAAAALTIQM